MRTLAITFLVVLSAADARANDAAPRPTADPVVACQVALARASRQLGDGIRRQVGRCLAAGAHCLTTGSNPAACCSTAAPRCHALELKLTRTAQRFAASLATGRCTRVAFASVLDPDVLGFESAAQTCRCLPSPTEVADLGSLGSCVARLVDAETMRLLAIAEAPRAAEALACVGLDHELAALETSDAALACDRPSPTAIAATPTPPLRETPTPTRTRRPRRTPKSGETSTPTADAPTPSATTSARPPTSTPAGAAPTPTPLTQTPTPAPTSLPVCGNGIVESAIATPTTPRAAPRTSAPATTSATTPAAGSPAGAIARSTSAAAPPAAASSSRCRRGARNKSHGTLRRSCGATAIDAQVRAPSCRCHSGWSWAFAFC
jgi:hypothetical protein